MADASADAPATAASAETKTATATPVLPLPAKKPKVLTAHELAAQLTAGVDAFAEIARPTAETETAPAAVTGSGTEELDDDAALQGLKQEMLPNAGWQMAINNLPEMISQIQGKEHSVMPADAFARASPAYRYSPSVSAALRAAFQTCCIPSGTSSGSGRVVVTVVDDLSHRTLAADAEDSEKAHDPNGDCSGGLFPNSVFFSGVEHFLRSCPSTTLDVSFEVSESHSDAPAEWVSHSKSVYDLPQLVASAVAARTGKVLPPTETAEGFDFGIVDANAFGAALHDADPTLTPMRVYKKPAGTPPRSASPDRDVIVPRGTGPREAAAAARKPPAPAEEPEYDPTRLVPDFKSASRAPLPLRSISIKLILTPTTSARQLRGAFGVWGASLLQNPRIRSLSLTGFTFLSLNGGKPLALITAGSEWWSSFRLSHSSPGPMSALVAMLTVNPTKRSRVLQNVNISCPLLPSSVAAAAAATASPTASAITGDTFVGDRVAAMNVEAPLLVRLFRRNTDLIRLNLTGRWLFADRDLNSEHCLAALRSVLTAVWHNRTLLRCDVYDKAVLAAAPPNTCRIASAFQSHIDTRMALNLKRLRDSISVTTDIGVGGLIAIITDYY